MAYTNSFKQSMSWVFRSEGGYVNNRHDPGGCTNLGITIGTLRKWTGRRISCRDVRRLTKETAMRIYKARYWDRVKGDLLPAGVNYVIFDMAVNAGPKRAIAIAQKVCRVQQDGIIGPVTVAAIRKMNALNFIRMYGKLRLAYYRRLRGWRHFGRGWAKRVKQATKRGIWLYNKFGNEMAMAYNFNPKTIIRNIDRISRRFVETFDDIEDEFEPEPYLRPLHGEKRDNSVFSRIKEKMFGSTIE